MISLEKWKILTPLQKLPKNVGDLGKIIVAKGFKKLPKVQKIATSGQTDHRFSNKEIKEIISHMHKRTSKLQLVPASVGRK